MNSSLACFLLRVMYPICIFLCDTMRNKTRSNGSRICVYITYLMPEPARGVINIVRAGRQIINNILFVYANTVIDNSAQHYTGYAVYPL